MVVKDMCMHTVVCTVQGKGFSVQYFTKQKGIKMLLG